MAFESIVARPPAVHTRALVLAAFVVAAVGATVPAVAGEYATRWYASGGFAVPVVPRDGSSIDMTGLVADAGLS